MAKLLLSSGQVQVLLSSALVAAVIFFLFLAGYTIQQHSIAALQSQLRPRVPSHPNVQQQTLAGPQNPSRLFSQEHNNDIAHHAEASRQKEPVDWKRLAHVQLVTDHHSVCSAMMIFGDLARLKSPARRVLVFPQQWAMEKQAAKHDTIDPYMDVTRRLLRRAARRYNVELRPVAFDSSSDSSAMASLWALTDMDRVMMLQTPGLIQHAELLDTLLAYSSSTAPLALLEPDLDQSLLASHLILATPSTQTHGLLTTSHPTNLSSITSLLTPGYLSHPNQLIHSIASLHNLSLAFNATQFISSPYIIFSDPKLPGPEWEVDYAKVVSARPKDKDRDWLWTKMYGEFAGRRYDTCGLGLEPWRD